MGPCCFHWLAGTICKPRFVHNFGHVTGTALVPLVCAMLRSMEIGCHTNLVPTLTKRLMERMLTEPTATHRNSIRCRCPLTVCRALKRGLPTSRLLPGPDRSQTAPRLHWLGRSVNDSRWARTTDHIEPTLWNLDGLPSSASH